MSYIPWVLSTFLAQCSELNIHIFFMRTEATILFWGHRKVVFIDMNLISSMNKKMPNFVHGTRDNKNKTYYTVNHKIIIDTSFLEDVWINDLWIIIKCKYNWDIMSCRSSTMIIYHGLLESTVRSLCCTKYSKWFHH